MSSGIEDLLKGIAAKDLGTTLRYCLSAYGKRKKIEMEHYGTPRDDMVKRWEVMKDWCSMIHDMTKRHPDPVERGHALDSLRPTVFGGRFDDEGKVMPEPVWPPERGTKPHNTCCNDHGLVWGPVYSEHGGKVFGVRACECGHGAQRSKAIKELGRKKRRRREREDEF